MKRSLRSTEAWLALPRPPGWRRSLSRIAGTLAVFGLGTGLINRPTLAAGYLAVIGPPALRFQSATPRADLSALPPLDLGKACVEASPAGTTNQASASPATSSANAAPTISPTSPASPDPAPTASPEVLGPEIQRTTAGAVGPVPAEAPGDLLASPATAYPIVTPQMLVQFFRPTGTNWMGLSAPVFVPPMPPVSSVPASSATYRSP